MIHIVLIIIISIVTEYPIIFPIHGRDIRSIHVIDDTNIIIIIILNNVPYILRMIDVHG